VIESPKKKTILVIDDSRADLKFIESVLGAAGYRVIPCEVSVECIHLLIEHEPDLVLLDVRMPLLEGDSLCTLVRPHTSAKIVLHSGIEEADLRALAESTGACGYLRKTADADELLAGVRRFLEG